MLYKLNQLKKKYSLLMSFKLFIKKYFLFQQVSNSEGDVKVSAEKCLEEVKKTSRKAKYESFLKTSTLTSQGYEEQTDTKQESITKPIKHVALTDEELLKACGKRTAHK